MTQAEKLDNLIRAAERCRAAASVDLIFASKAGAALLLAIHDLTEIDAVYDKALDTEREAGGSYMEAAE